MSQFGAAALGIGGLLSGVGSIFGANAANDAGARSLDLYKTETGNAKVLPIFEALGADAPAFLRAMLPRDEYNRLFGSDPQELQRQIQAVQQYNASGAVPVTRNNRTGVRPGFTPQAVPEGSKGVFDLQALTDQYAGSKGTVGQYQGVADEFKARGASDLAMFDSDTSKLARQGTNNLARIQANTRGLVNEASKYGAGREAQIARDSERARKSANDESAAFFAGSGLGNSTLLGNQLGANNRLFEEKKQDALQNLADNKVGLTMGAKQWGYGQQAAGADSNLARASQRSFGRSTLAEGIRGQDQSLAMMPIQARQQAFSGGTFNPFLGQNTSQYFPGASAFGSFAANTGNALAQLGSASLFSNFGAGGSGGKAPALSSNPYGPQGPAYPF